MKRKFFSAACVAAAVVTTGCSSSSSGGVSHDLQKLIDVLTNDADIAHAVYSDAHEAAVALQAAVRQFKVDAADGVTEVELQAVKDAWLVAREAYGPSEAYRFRGGPIDTDTTTGNEGGPEGSLNAWPLGEALIDYVDTGASTPNNDFDQGQVETDHTVGGGITDPLDTAAAAADDADNIIGSAVTLDGNLLDLTEGGDGADVISGYHAIEFILWGQDLAAAAAVTSGDRIMAVKTQDASNYQAGGDRRVEDFDLQNNGTCTTGVAGSTGSDVPCQRRHDYMQVVADRIVDELADLVAAWAPGSTTNFRATALNVSTIDEAKAKLLDIVTGMGTMAVGELAGERMQIAFAGDSQEDEHSCFSDNTHRDIVLNAQGVVNAFTGEYAGYDSTLDGTADMTSRAIANGYGIEDYLNDIGQSTLATAVGAAMDTVMSEAGGIDALARGGKPVDVQISPPIAATDPMARTILSLNAAGAALAEMVTTLGLGNVGLDDFEDTACDTTDPTQTSADCGA